MPIELHGVVRLTNPDDEGIFFWTPPIILKLSVWGDKEFKKVTTNCLKTKWDDNVLRLLSTMGARASKLWWTEEDCENQIASYTWRSRDGWWMGIKQ